MEVSKIPNLQKCGEILMDIKSKNKKNKIYIFHCTFCNLECDQLKKFSLHIGEEHLNDFEDILKETELKFEAEPEEVKLQSFTDIDSSDIKVFESSIDSKTNINPDPLDTVNAASTAKNAENLICEVKYEIIDQDESAGNMGVLDGTVSISDSDKDENDKDFVFDSDSDEDYKVDVDEAPLKKRKINKNVKKGKKAKLKENSNDSDTDESKDAECNDLVFGLFSPECDLEPNSERNIRKYLKNSGKSYITKSGKLISERKVKPLENCKNKCKEKVSMEQQQIIFNYYWNLGYHHLRQMFIANLVDAYKTQQHRKNRLFLRERNYSYRYFLEIDGQRIKVCQKCFRYTLCETEQFLRITKRRKMEGRIMEGDRRGKHGKATTEAVGFNATEWIPLNNKNIHIKQELCV